MSKKTKIIFWVAITLAVLFGAFLLISNSKNQEQGMEVNVGENWAFDVKNTDPMTLDEDRVYSDDYRVGTTTDPSDDSKSNFTYLDAGNTATSSIIVYSERAFNVDLLGFVVASSTATRLHICREYSHSGSDYFAEINLTDNTNTETTFSGPRCFEFVPDHTATTTFALPASPVTAKYSKISFTATGADAAVWFQTVAKEPTN